MLYWFLAKYLEVVDVESITNISPTTKVVGENEVIKKK